MFACTHHLGILSLRVWFVTFVAPFIALSKQAPHTWFQHFASVVTVADFSASAHDPALFVHMSPRGRTLLPFYVDDMIITGDDPEYITFVKAHLSDQFLMSDLGLLRYFLEIEISTFDGFFLSQEKYIQDVLDRASLTNHRTTETPMKLNVHVTLHVTETLIKIINK
jgi:hypothetical protein